MLLNCVAQKVELFALIQSRRVLMYEFELKDCLKRLLRVEKEESTFSSSGERMRLDWSSARRYSAWRQEWRSKSVTEGEARLSLKG